MRLEANLWLRLSEPDLETAGRLLDMGIYYASVFFTQHSAKKALRGSKTSRKAILPPAPTI